MMDKKHNEPQDDSYYDALIKQRIGEALRNQSRKERLDLAQLEEWVEADRQRRRAKVKRILAVASCFIILCIGTFSLKFVFDPDDSIATAGKNDNKVTEEGNNVVVKPNEGNVDENVGITEVNCSSWEDIGVLKKKFPELAEPTYVPEGYEFKELKIEYNDIMEKYTYVFRCAENELKVKQVRGSEATVLNKYDRKIQCDYGDILIVDDVGITAACKIKKGVIFVSANLSDDEFIKIMNNIE